MMQSLPRGRPVASLDTTARHPNRIRELRIKADLSQRDLGHLVKRSQTQIGALERGAYRPSQDLLEDIARHLHCEWWDLYYRPAAAVHERLLRDFSSLTEDQQKKALAFIRALKSNKIFATAQRRNSRTWQRS